jgi:hypothetical protein
MVRFAATSIVATVASSAIVRSISRPVAKLRLGNDTTTDSLGPTNVSW